MLKKGTTQRSDFIRSFIKEQESDRKPLYSVIDREIRKLLDTGYIEQDKSRGKGKKYSKITLTSKGHV